jgi:hypothetical protein
VAAAAAVGAAAVVPATSAGASTGVPTVTVKMGAKTIGVVGGSHLHAGRVILKVTAGSGDHVLQLLRLKPGYTAAQAKKDADASFNGDLKALRRVDTKVVWLGGAEATKGHPGYLSETLYAGTYYFVDQNGPAMQKVTVSGAVPQRPWIANSSTLTATKAKRWSTSASAIPHSGWTLFRNTGDQPHFVVLQQVKKGTTRQDVIDYLQNAGPDSPPPSWALAGEASSGVVSQQQQVLWKYDVPRGSYALMCFWSDIKTGMPHAMMGMVKIITMK